MPNTYAKDLTVRGTVSDGSTSANLTLDPQLNSTTIKTLVEAAPPGSTVTFSDVIPIVLYDVINVPANVTLTFQPGTIQIMDTPTSNNYWNFTNGGAINNLEINGNGGNWRPSVNPPSAYNMGVMMRVQAGEVVMTRCKVANGIPHLPYGLPTTAANIQWMIHPLSDLAHLSHVPTTGSPPIVENVTAASLNDTSLITDAGQRTILDNWLAANNAQGQILIYRETNILQTYVRDAGAWHLLVQYNMIELLSSTAKLTCNLCEFEDSGYTMIRVSHGSHFLAQNCFARNCLRWADNGGSTDTADSTIEILDCTMENSSAGIRGNVLANKMPTFIMRRSNVYFADNMSHYTKNTIMKVGETFNATLERVNIWAEHVRPNGSYLMRLEDTGKIQMDKCQIRGQIALGSWNELIANNCIFGQEDPASSMASCMETANDLADYLFNNCLFQGLSASGVAIKCQTAGGVNLNNGNGLNPGGHDPGFQVAFAANGAARPMTN